MKPTALALAQQARGGTGWERTPWHATKRAAWEALHKNTDR
jgi:hypothetical protein